MPPSATFICKGDLHGDIHSFIKFVEYLQEKGYTSSENPLKLIAPDLYLIFLGDYVDRGLYGVEVLYLLMLLKINNPSQVILVRGNHEDPDLNSVYSFSTEFFGKYAQKNCANKEATYAKVAQIYNLMPLVLYIGCGASPTNFIQCCHGGLEPGYNPQLFFQSVKTYEYFPRLNRYNAFAKEPSYTVNIDGKIHGLATVCQKFRPITLTRPHFIGFAWSDFVVDPEGLSVYRKNRGFAFNKRVTDLVFQQASTSSHKLVSIIRAHQHVPSNEDPLMKLMLQSHGSATLWNNRDYVARQGIESGTVHTLLLSPGSLYGIRTDNFTGFDYDTFLIGTTGEELKDWRMVVINNVIFNQEAHQSSSHLLTALVD